MRHDTGPSNIPTFPGRTDASLGFADALAASERMHWRVEDLIGGDRQLDFALPFLPETLARVEELDFLSDAERRALNQIRAHGYLYMFGLVEEFILPFVLDHARPQLGGDPYRVRALLQFAAEEAKHIHLFKRFREAFFAGFGSACEVVGPARDIARRVLAHHPLGVALVILHIEWMTQRHYVDSVKDDRGLDPQFRSLLKHHWMDEAQHARLDLLIVEAMAAACRPEEVAGAVDEYLSVETLLDGLLQQQVGLDLVALQRATGRILSTVEAERFAALQLQALRWTFIGSGMTHPTFLDAVEQLDPPGRERLDRTAAAFC